MNKRLELRLDPKAMDEFRTHFRAIMHMDADRHVPERDLAWWLERSDTDDLVELPWSVLCALGAYDVDTFDQVPVLDLRKLDSLEAAEGWSVRETNIGHRVGVTPRD